MQAETRLADSPSDVLILGRPEVSALLDMYREDAVFLEDCRVQGNKLTATARSFTHPFRRSEPKHLTRTHVLTFVTQGAFVLGHYLETLDGEPLMSPAAFHELAGSERAVFASVEMRFRGHEQRREQIELTMRCQRIRKIGARFVIHMDFEVGRRCRGGLVGLIAC